jgi:hypothetical protein
VISNAMYADTTGTAPRKAKTPTLTMNRANRPRRWRRANHPEPYSVPARAGSDRGVARVATPGGAIGTTARG